MGWGPLYTSQKSRSKNKNVSGNALWAAESTMTLRNVILYGPFKFFLIARILCNCSWEGKLLDGGFHSPGFEFHFRISCCFSSSFISNPLQLGHWAPISSKRNYASQIWKMCAFRHLAHRKSYRTARCHSGKNHTKTKGQRSHGIFARWNILFSSISLFKHLFNPRVKEC